MRKHLSTLSASLLLVFPLLWPAGARAQGAEALKGAVQRALASSPDVSARLNALRAAGFETEAARGALRPQVDADATLGISRDSYANRTPAGESVTQGSAGVTLRQLLWDGQASRSEVGRLDALRASRYFEYIDASEQTALEAARAWYDVLRFRRLVVLAEDNYVQHRLANDQITSRVKAGVGRRVDLEQAAARLALAQSNLGTEVANLHDVTARYLRVVGDAPPDGAALDAGVTAGVPFRGEEVQTRAAQRSPAVAAAIENLRAARMQVRAQQGADQPRAEVRAFSRAGHNLGGATDRRFEMGAELVVNLNLLNGGTHKARVQQLGSLLAQAADQRDRACRDVRQTAAIAFNDIQKLKEQLKSLLNNTDAIARARDAYRQQFEIGQRSLLDLLNAENEVYTAKRAYANAEVDLRLAYLRTQAAMHNLTASLDLMPLEASGAIDSAWAAGQDAAIGCTAADPSPKVTPINELDARAQTLAQAQTAARAVAEAKAAAEAKAVADAAAKTVAAAAPPKH